MCLFDTLKFNINEINVQVRSIHDPTRTRARANNRCCDLATPVLLLGTGYPPISPVQSYGFSQLLQFLATTFGKIAPPRDKQKYN